MTETPKPQLPADNVNPFQQVGQQAPRRIIGELLKFSKGDYLRGQDNEEVAMGTRLIANMDQLLHGWIRWEDNKPAEQLMGLVVQGFKPAKRSELGFTDDTEWEVDPSSNQPRDPWQFTYYLVAREVKADGTPTEGSEGLYTFTTSSTGGKDAIISLCSAYGEWMRVKPDQYPIITLAMDKYKHPNAAYGIIKKPKFEFNPKRPTCWIAKDKFGEIVDAPPGDDDGEDIPF